MLQLQLKIISKRKGRINIRNF